LPLAAGVDDGLYVGGPSGLLPGFACDEIYGARRCGNDCGTWVY